jgi:hypothetical protein
MKRTHDKARPGRVAEPAQVYLEPPDLERLARLTSQLEATKSDVLRRGLAALERELLDPERHPALRLIGIGRGAERRPAPGYDVAREHDRFLADSEVSPASKARKSRGRPGAR